MSNRNVLAEFTIVLSMLCAMVSVAVSKIDFGIFNEHDTNVVFVSVAIILTIVFSIKLLKIHTIFKVNKLRISIIFLAMILRTLLFTSMIISIYDLITIALILVYIKPFIKKVGDE